MSKVFKRLAIFPVPAFALQTVLGEFSQEVLGSARVLPKVLLDSGFKFQDADIESAMRTLAAK
jgi:NAD dependent epimerase/dehydratase family enzyme